MPQINPEGENLAQSIEAIGTIGFGTTSIPIGSILILLRNICPGADSGLIISGCLQKSESDICLISYMKSKNSSWSICKEIENTQNVSTEELSSLVSDLAFNIYFELLQLQSKLNVPAMLQSLHIGGDPSRIDTKHVLPSWKVLKDLTEAIEALQTYSITKESKDLDRARTFGLKAARVDPYYNDPLYLLYNVGIAYLNKKKNCEAERLARYIVALRPDSPLVWYSWGLTLKFLTLNNEAIECYDKALSLDGFVEEEKDKIETEIYFMKAVSLRDLKHFDEAIIYFNYYFEKKSDNGYAWGHYGITLEAKAKSLDDETLRDEAERAFQKAIKFCPDFVSVHAALARIYRKKNLDKDASDECSAAQKYMQARKKQNEYNRACFEINCGDKNKAQELLKTAINENQITRQWIKEDPDWDSARDEQWFIDLLETKSHESTDDTNELIISKIAIRRKLDKEGGRNPFFFYKYDIEDPKILAEKILEENYSNISAPIIKLTDEERRNLKTLKDESNTEKILVDLGSNDLLEPYAIREPYLIQRTFIEEKVKRSEKLEKALCDILNKSLTDHDLFDDQKNNKVKAAYLDSQIGNRLIESELREKALEKIYHESFFIRSRFHAASENVDNALNLLFWALDNEQISTEEVIFEPDFEFVRDDPRFTSLVDEFSQGKKLNS